MGNKTLKSSNFSGKIDPGSVMKASNNMSFQKSLKSREYNYETSIHTNRTENMQAFLEKKEHNQKATDDLRHMRIRRLHDQTNKKFKVDFKGGQVAVTDSEFQEDINLGMKLAELPPVKLDI
jgi:hypothetical protein